MTSFRPPSLDAPSQTVIAPRGGDAKESAYAEANAALPPEMPEMPERHSSLPLEIYKALTALDDQLVAALERRDVRLVRPAWLLAQPEGYRMQRRQALEELERGGASPSPLLSPDEAVQLIRRGDRSVGALSYGERVMHARAYMRPHPPLSAPVELDSLSLSCKPRMEHAR